jgi:TfoX/Sxy family transcriptional regulator of competence genes
MKWKKSPDSLIQFLDEIMKDVECEKRKMFGYPCYFINGNMFTGAFQDNIILRLTKEDKEEILDPEKGIRQFEPMGRAMKEYVALTKDVYNDKELFRNLLLKSIDYVKILPPKTKQKRASSK